MVLFVDSWEVVVEFIFFGCDNNFMIYIYIIDFSDLVFLVFGVNVLFFICIDGVQFGVYLVFDDVCLYSFCCWDEMVFDNVV